MHAAGWVGRFVGALVLAACWAGQATEEASAQGSTANGGRLTLAGTFDGANAYLFRGLPQDDTKVILWPAIEAGVALSPSVVLNLGLWNSLHTGAAGLDGPSGKLWYQSDFSAGVTVGAAGGLRVGGYYAARTSPNNAFPSVQEVGARLEHGGFLRPYALLAFEIDGQFDGGRNEGRYLEVGASPTWGTGFAVSVPVKAGFSLGDYYENLLGDERFGFLSVGGRVSRTIADGAAGRWNVHGGADLVVLGDRSAIVLGSDTTIVGSAGIGFSY